MSIFIQIAAYRDSLLASTINDLISKAEDPISLKIVVCNQFHPQDEFNKEIDAYREDSRVKIIDVLYSESKGVCWARNLIQQQYNDEEYTLQIDSHMRFVEKWDRILIDMLEELRQKGIKKPVLTTYPPHFEPDDFTPTNTPPNRILLLGFHHEGIPFCWPDIIPNWNQQIEPLPARFFAGGFSFASGIICREVPHDPQLYFGGEEINIMLRAYTRGYDFFHPHKNITWHYYSRTKSPKHWDDHPKSVEAKLNKQAYYRLERLFDNKYNDTCDSWGVYGLGKERSLRDYEKYAGILLHEKKVQEFAFKNMPPPGLDIYVSEKEWAKSFFSHFNDTLKISTAGIKERDFTEIILSFSCNNEIVHQIFLSPEQIGAMFDAKTKNEYKIDVNFLAKSMPDSWMLSMHSSSKGWIKPVKANTVYLSKGLNKFSVNGCWVL
jgi:glycosyltransferase involved in cell wall biosynthesis